MDSSKQAKTFYVRDILAVIWKRKWLVVIPIFLVTAITAASTFYISPIYEASVTIFMEKPVRLSQDIQRLIGGAGSSIGGNPETMTRELQSLQNEIVSAPYIAQLVTNIGLDKEPSIELMARKMQVNQPNVTLEDLKFDMLLESLRNRIRVEFAGINQVRILAQSSSAEQAKLIVQNLGDIFIQEKTKQESRSISASSDFSSDQLATYDKDLQDKINEKTELEKELLRVQLDEVVAAPENRKQINMEVQAITQEISEKEKEVRETQMRLSSMAGGIPTIEEPQSMIEKKSEINKLLASMPDLMQKYSWNTPSLVSFKVRLYGLASDVDEAVAREVRVKFPQQSEASKNDLITLFSSRLRLETLYAYNNNLKLALADLDRRVGLMPGFRAKIEQLSREIDASRNLRDQFKLSQEGTQISQALLMESKFRVVEPARLPLSPIWPNKKMIVLLGFLVGISLGAGAVIIAEFFDNSITKIEDAELMLGFPVVGTMPKIEGLEKLKVHAGR
ncbi:MAG: Wzz/FepE/Etk N-terminal domain-containing protein [Candidatus Zixiibacteriota bacterium]